MLAGADLNNVLYIINEDFSIADIAGIKRFLNGFYKRFNRYLADHDIDFDLGQQTRTDGIASEIDAVPFLRAVAEYVCNRYARYAKLAERLFQFAELALICNDGNLGDLCAGRFVVNDLNRLSSCVFCDRIAVFDHAELVQTGTHAELLASGGKYAELWNAQAEYYLQ